MIDAYFKLEILSSEIRKKNKIRSSNRFDCTLFANEYPGIDCFKNKKGMFFLYLNESEHFIKSSSKRKADFVLINNKTNFTSLYKDSDNYKFYGYPNGKLTLSDGSINPSLPFKNDAYLFQISKDFKTIELYILKNNKGSINNLYQLFIDGELDEQIQSLKDSSKPFYNYCNE